MWWDWGCCNCCFKPINKKQLFSLPFKQNQHQQHLLPIQVQEENDDARSNPPLFALAMIFTSWLSRSTSRYLILALCSPLLLPLFCATFPFLCALELFFRLCRRRKRRRKRTTVEDCGGDLICPCEETEHGGKLLQRYLEDQLILVTGSVYECGGDDDDEDDDDEADIEYFHSTSPSLQ